ncbi:MAG TPA: hypothetical protein VK815_04555 [Candidatus Acidoferrales bacterium]|jgi:hypothetical protein|nr:hypothetical protein [Candidatus Acidoferrales bacterium]
MNKSRNLASLFLIPLLLTGCITHRTIQSEPRQSVTFASTHAAQTFYDTYLALNHPSASGKGDVSFGLVLPYRHYTVRTENVRFNEAVKSADTDHDGIISDTEADTYAKKIKPSANAPAPLNL